MTTDPQHITTRAGLHAALESLYEERGLSYNELAARADRSPATIHALVRGDSFPRWPTLRKFLIACDVPEGTLDAWRAAHRRAERAKRPERDLRLERARSQGLVPLPGLENTAVDPPSGIHEPDPRRGRLRRAVRAVLAVAAMLLPGRRGNAGDMRRRRMLLKVRRQMELILQDAETPRYVTPRFVLLREQPASGGRRRSRSIRRAEPVSVPTGETDIRRLYEQADEELVLLGLPGMGKTVQLARLTHALVTETLAEMEHPGSSAARPIPVYLNLASYRGQSLEDWIAAEVGRFYNGVSEWLVRSWLAQDLLLPVFDGLDQVPGAHRAECARRLRHLRESCAGIVVGCRYDELPLARTIDAVLYVQVAAPTREQVQDYLLADTEALADVHAALRADPDLWPLLQSPLMLNVIHGAYEGRAATALHEPGHSNHDRQGLILDAYLRRRLLDDPPAGRRGGAGQALVWLTWLARTLTDRGEEILYLDRLDLDWLPARRQILARVVNIQTPLLLGGALVLAWLAAFVAHGTLSTNLGDAALLLAVTMTVTTVQAVLAENLDEGKPTTSRRLPVKVAANLPMIVLGGVVLRVVDWHTPGVVVVALSWAWLQFTSMEDLFRPTFRPVEDIRWTWRPREWIVASTPGRNLALRILISFALVAVLSALCVYLVGRLFPEPGWLPLAAALLLWNVYVFGNGFEPSLRDRRPHPNEGIRRSVRFALAHGVLTALAVTGALIALVLVVVPGADPHTAWLVAGFLGSLYGLARGLRYGGLAVVQHWTVRAQLARQGHVPRRYQRFLTDCERRIILRRLDSGYLFHHRLIQEHLATDPAALARRLNLTPDSGTDPDPDRKAREAIPRP
ncbi:helix-turn-helix domain-containing protein [Actinomadura kijaniata]|uniref:helix-turn-helix domain-containing protein n=1 Tax=Actinomadura kijaniata TaxID=46161 RepID=UPI003F1D50B2